jgi:hypothetical protein
VALYIPAGQRRRRTIVTAAIALLLGVAIGVFVGRGSAPSLDDQIHAVQADARQTAAGLRVLAFHDQSGAIANGAPGNGGADLVLQRTRTELDHEFARAPWLGRSQRDDLDHALDALAAMPDRTSASFGTAAEALADQIDTTFGIDG